jgi:hypothetical protein
MVARRVNAGLRSVIQTSSKPQRGDRVAAEQFSRWSEGLLSPPDGGFAEPFYGRQPKGATEWQPSATVCGPYRGHRGWLQLLASVGPGARAHIRSQKKPVYAPVPRLSLLPCPSEGPLREAPLRLDGTSSKRWFLSQVIARASLTSQVRAPRLERSAG